MTLRILSIASSAFILDRITKFTAYNNLSPEQSLSIIPNIFHLTLVLNKAAAFGLFMDQRAFFISVSVIAIALIIIYIFKCKKKSLFLSSALGLILGGAAGNLFDRIRFGYVIDFLDFRIWPVFNMADACITIGAAMLVASTVLLRNFK